MSFVKKLPREKQPISTSWVFVNNKIIKRKARLVARGFAQRYGIDYELTYSSILNVDCIKLLLAFAAQFQWTVYQLDFKICLSKCRLRQRNLHRNSFRR